MQKFFFIIITLLSFAGSAVADSTLPTSTFVKNFKCPIKILDKRQSISVAFGVENFWEKLSEKELIKYADQGHFPAIKLLAEAALDPENYNDYYIYIQMLTCNGKKFKFFKGDEIPDIGVQLIEYFSEYVWGDLTHGDLDMYSLPNVKKRADILYLLANKLLDTDEGRIDKGVMSHIKINELEKRLNDLSLLERHRLGLRLIIEGSKMWHMESSHLFSTILEKGMFIQKDRNMARDLLGIAYLSGVMSENKKYIRYKTTGCLGSCPIYTIILFQSGEVIYVGEEYVPIHGFIKASYNPVIIRNIEKLIKEYSKEKLPLRDLESCYDYSDSSSVFINFSTDTLDRKSDIYHYYGCKSQKNIKKLEELILKIDALLPYKELGFISKDNFLKTRKKDILLPKIPDAHDLL